MLEKLYITEDPSENPHRWSVSFGGPEFQGFPTIDIDEKTAQEIMMVQKESTEQVNEPMPFLDEMTRETQEGLDSLTIRPTD